MHHFKANDSVAFGTFSVLQPPPAWFQNISMPSEGAPAPRNHPSASCPRGSIRLFWTFRANGIPWRATSLWASPHHFSAVPGAARKLRLRRGPFATGAFGVVAQGPFPGVTELSSVLRFFF